MYVTIDESACVGCGSCEALCPAVFAMTDRGTAEPILGRMILRELQTASVSFETLAVVV